MTGRSKNRELATVPGPRGATLIVEFESHVITCTQMYKPEICILNKAYCILHILKLSAGCAPKLEVGMNNAGVFERMKRAIESAPRNGYVAELHLQVIKYADLLEHISGKEFCEKLDLKPAWGTEFAKMRKIAGRLREAGLEPERI
jgi:hypothetical protein